MVYERLLRPLLFGCSPAAAHDLGLGALGVLDTAPMVRAIEMTLSDVPQRPVECMGLRFRHPVGLAGGFDKNARVPSALLALGFSFLELGTVTALPQAANPAPNIFRLPADRALINRLGFPNEGARVVAARIGARRASRPFSAPVGTSIGKSRAVPVDDESRVLADYTDSLRAVLPVSDFVVVNVSSPNTANLRALQSADTAERLLRVLQAAAVDAGFPRMPLLLKVAPDLTDEGFDALLDVVRRVGLTGIIAANTTVKRDGLKTDAGKVTALGAGGLSGPPVRERALAMVSRARQALGSSATIVGVGGIEEASHARAYLDAGANLVQLYTGFIYGGPLVARTIAAGL